MRRTVFIITSLVIGTLILCAFFLGYDLPTNWQYAFERRGLKIIAIVLVSCAVAFSSITFQTLTSNRILTPSIMGFEAVYLLFQTLLIFLYGTKSFDHVNSLENFFFSILLMLGFAFALFYFIFKKGKNNIFRLLLIGLVLGTLFHTISSFLQLIIDPNEFLMLQGTMYATFNDINFSLLWYALVVLVVCFVVSAPKLKLLNVILLGRENAINLGVDYFKTVRFFLFVIAIMVSVSTALVGPIIFLGLLVSNLTYELLKEYKHQILIPACSLICIISILVAQFMVENIFNFNASISIIINFIGGIYFMYLLLKTNKL
ncbi:iron chelate uptake ABC transporter family permease subunit [Maribacter dokdonensis]|uniref:iron chelate uptake ABC transporter family permease subunit n=1 Tax=Maribacter dokdonensis TaxID=320912 RepID=UPI002AB1E36D|nr:iron chelate uptake ABC transporter family permease subunit [Maribacter dokdonensis]